MPKIIVCDVCGDGHWEDRTCPSCAEQVEPMTIPQELVDRVAEAFWNEGRCETNWSFAEMLHLMEDPDADVPRDSVKWIRGKARAGIAAMLDGVTLEWKSHEQDTERTETEFGRYTVHFGGPFPVYSTPDRDGNHGSDDPKAAALADYRARLLKAMGGV